MKWPTTLLILIGMSLGMMFLTPGLGTRAGDVLAAANPAPAGANAAIASVGTGNWSDPATWDLGRVPRAGDAVRISSGTLVAYDVVSDDVLGEIGIDGTLRFSRTSNTRLKVNDNILVRSGGYLDQGTVEDFIPRTTSAEIIFVLTQTQANAYVGGPAFEATDIGLWVLPGGTWDVHGAPLLRTWSKLAKDALPGATNVVVENDVNDWYTGGTVILSSTRVPRTFFIERDRERYSTIAEHELATIQSITKLSDGKTEITFNEPLEFPHEGTYPFQGEVGLLTRNILITTELLGADASLLIDDVRPRKFAHTIYMPGATGDIQYVEFKHMGHYGKLGRYATHHHQMLETSKGMIVRGISGWYNGFRCVNLHVTHGVLVEDNVCYSSSSTAFFSEIDDIGVLKDNAFVHNLAVGTKNKHFRDRQDASIAGEHWRNGGFWPITWSHEALLGNVAAGDGGGSGGGSSGGFMFRARQPESQGNIPFTFVANEAHSNFDAGIFHWQNLVPVRDLVGSLLWRNGADGIKWGAYETPYKYYNTALLENGISGLDIVSTGTFLQDSIVSGHAGDNSKDDIGINLRAYILPAWPSNPIWLVRNTFENIRTAGIFQAQPTCDDDFDLTIQERPVLPGTCSAFYTIQMGNTFKNVGKSINFGFQPNPNSWSLVFDHVGPEDLPKDFVITRADLLDESQQGVITKELVNQDTFYSPEVDGLITPIDSLPDVIEFTGLLNEKNLDKQDWGGPADFTFSTAPDYPPEIALSVTLDGDIATMKAHVTDDRNPSPKVEFFVDWMNVGTFTSPPYEVSVDLSRLPSNEYIAPRRYAYLYARAFDGTKPLKFKGREYEQRAYTNVIEIGPEVLIAGGSQQPLPNQAPFVDAGQNATLTMASPTIVFLDGTVNDDDLPNPPGAVTTTWSKVSGPDPVTFANTAAVDTTASFSVQGTYVLRLTASDGELSAGDNVTITVTPPPVLTTIAVSPTSATVRPGGTRQFTAEGLDQLGDPMTIASPVWSVSGGGTIDQTGLFTSGATEGGPFTVTAAVGSLAGTATVTVSANARVIDGLVALYDFSEGSGTTVHDVSNVGTPLDLNVLDLSRIRWLPGSNGMEFLSGGAAIKAPSSATKIHNSISATGRLTLEAWVTPANLDQGGPARIVTMSEGTSSGEVNFHLGQDGSGASFRLRTTSTGFSWMHAPNVFADTTIPRHIVTTYDGATQRMFVDGVLQGTTNALSGDFSNWNSSYPIVIGNEATLDRSWLGKVFLVAAYDRVLSQQEIQQNFDVGPGGSGPPPPTNQAPTVSITSPADGAFFLTTDSIAFSGTGSDSEAGLLTGASLVWTSSIDGQIGTGTSFNASLSDGDHTIILTATDGRGASGSASTNVTVNPAPVNQAPTVSITSPADGAIFLTTDGIAFNGSGDDPEEGSLANASLVWTSSIDGQLGTGASLTASLSTGGHIITLTATDGQGASGNSTVNVTVNQVPVVGDADGDGQFTFTDIFELVDWLIGRKPAPVADTPRFVAADVNGDKVINLTDITLMIDRMLGRIDKFPVE